MNSPFWWAGGLLIMTEYWEPGWSQDNGAETKWNRGKNRSVSRENLERSRTHLSGRCKVISKEEPPHNGTNGLVHMTAQFGMTEGPWAGPSACCLGFKWPNACGEIWASRCVLFTDKSQDWLCRCQWLQLRGRSSWEPTLQFYCQCEIDIRHSSFGFSC